MLKRFFLISLIALFLLPALVQAKNLVRIGENAIVTVELELQDVVVINGDAEISGRVLGNVIVIGGDIVLNPSAYVSGDVVCLGGILKSSTAAIIKGSKVEIGGKISWKSLPYFSIAKLMFLSFLYKISTAVILVLLCVFFVLMWPNQIRYAAQEASHDLVKSILVGIFAVALLVPLGIGFAITLFGLPIAFAILVFLLIASWFGIASMAYLVGTKISNRFSPLVAVIFGLLILKFVHFVPFIGFILYFIAILPGLGAILLTRFGTNRPWMGSKNEKSSKKK
ncbi:polymer-forming cytoskeletal protein [bacterium]|nr:polymer-forming cytoskeletal protein [bacterium]